MIFKFGNTPLKSFPARDAPYYEAEGVAACSPRLPDQSAFVLTARRREPGSILGNSRTPRERSCEASSSWIPPRVLFEGLGHAGTTNADGEVRFDGVQAGEHTLDAFVPEVVPPAVGVEDAPLPEEKSLVGRVGFSSAVCPRSWATAPPPSRTRPCSAGYVPGTLRPPSGRSVADCQVTALPTIRRP